VGSIKQYMRRVFSLPLDPSVCWLTGVKRPTTEVRKNAKEGLPKVHVSPRSGPDGILRHVAALEVDGEEAHFHQVYGAGV
jgi:hypothetical protein